MHLNLNTLLVSVAKRLAASKVRFSEPVRVDDPLDLFVALEQRGPGEVSSDPRSVNGGAVSRVLRLKESRPWYRGTS